MIQAGEHHYNDDPRDGHPDVRTRLKDVSYFFIGNGALLAAVQVAPGGEGTPLGLLIWNPDRFLKKREVPTMDPASGLEETAVRLVDSGEVLSAKPETITAFRDTRGPLAAVSITWENEPYLVEERFFCLNEKDPVLVRAVSLLNRGKDVRRVLVSTGVRGFRLEEVITLTTGSKRELCLLYHLDLRDHSVSLSRGEKLPEIKTTGSGPKKPFSISFRNVLLDRYAAAAADQLPAVISETGKVDASIWQYNHEWVRDVSWMALGLLFCGEFALCRILLQRMMEHCVSPDGDTVDSGARRDPEDVELDQNGELLYVLARYVRWTGDGDFIRSHRDKIGALAEFPLGDQFRHPVYGLLTNRRDYWERHRIHGIRAGMELAHQLFVVLGLEAAGEMADILEAPNEGRRWMEEAARLKRAFLREGKGGFVQNGHLVKRLDMDGMPQDRIEPLPEAALPEGVPLASAGSHFLHPDMSASLPIVFGLVSPDSATASLTMEKLESLWNQAWTSGGYGRYHVSSEPDSPGGWTFPSLFAARAYAEMGRWNQVWKILHWLDSVPGAGAASWFEFYGNRIAPPFPQVGIPPWTWAEMLTLFIHHMVGLRPQRSGILLRPNLPPGVRQVEARFPFREGTIELDLLNLGDGRTEFEANVPTHREGNAVFLSPDRKDIFVHMVRHE
ncbi:MAG: hypothetical protein MUP70_13750 [Candidatus Aminicenantes bacterium]|nr:hypothetical protein [Candidatus Aminicenantes bacterium]